MNPTPPPNAHTCTGLTSSILTNTFQAKLSEHNPTPISQTEETNTKPSEPASDDSIAPDFHSPLSKSNSTHISDSTQYFRSIDESTPIVPGTFSRELNVSADHTLTCDTSTNESHMHDTMTSASFDMSLDPAAHKAIERCHDKLVTALSTDILSISNILFEKEFISEEMHGKLLLTTVTEDKRATDLVIAIRKKIKLVPNRFQELIKIFSEQTCTKDIVMSLSSHVSYQQVPEIKKQDKAEVIATSQKFAVCESHMYTAWETLNRDDKSDLKARLLTDAETIGKKFALLYSKARDSFERRGITPQMLTDTLLDLTVYQPGSSCHDIVPLLNEDDGILMRAETVRETFHALRPHMSFFNYEILQFLIEAKGSGDDKIALATFLGDFTEFCKRHVFEVPFTMYSNGHHFDDRNTKKRLHVKVTEHFKAALLIKNTPGPEVVPSTNDNSEDKNVCSSKLGINLEDAKNIQRKLATILGLNPSSLFLDTISEGSIILTFLLPICVSLTGLDYKPEIKLLLSNGITILCGPAGKPERKKLTSNGIVMRWSLPEYGCDSLAQYSLFYQKKYTCETSEWQKLELDSLETHTCVSDLDVGDTYIFKICAISDVGTLQYSNESDPIVLYNSRISAEGIYTVISTCHEMTTLALSIANTNKIAANLLANKIISIEHEAEITLVSKPSEQAVILSAAVHQTMESEPEKFQKFLNILSTESLIDSVVETLQSVFYHSVCIQYAGYLKFLYVNLHNKQTSSNQWPPSATHKFFRLAMIKTAPVKREHIDDEFVRQTITGKVDDILQHKYPIELKNIFLATPGRRKVVLLEGAPGCGKSTLSVYICQQWEKGQLFNQFQLVVLVQLRDPAVQNAECLADLHHVQTLKQLNF